MNKEESLRENIKRLIFKVEEAKRANWEQLRYGRLARDELYSWFLEELKKLILAR